MAQCKICGYPMNENETVCPMCGAEATAAKAQSSPVQPAADGVELCPACGCPVEANDTVCSLCGRELRPAAKAAAPQPVQSPAGRHRCPFCGAEAGAGAQFCPSCGKRLTQSGTTAAPTTEAEKKRVDKGVNTIIFWVVVIAVAVGFISGWLGL